MPQTTSPSFESLSTPLLAEDGHALWQVPDGWQQGRGAFGGLVLAAAVRVMEASAPADQPLRSLTATLCGPLQPGDATLPVQVLRAGRHTTAVETRLLQGDGVCAQATGFFGRARVPDGDWATLPSPAAGDFRDARPMTLPAPPAPVFSRHFEYRPTGPAPFSGAAERAVSGWVRYRGPVSPDAAYVVALADAYWPAALTTFRAPRPMATVTSTVELLADPGTLPTDAPLYYRATSPAAAGGYAAELRELWTAEGRLVALNHQTFCLIA